MPVTCVVGLQWGDEAKGKIVDLLTEQHEIVVRYQGGSNAGHTVVFGGESFKLSLIPSGIFRPKVQCVIAGGVVLNPKSLLAEIDNLTERKIRVAENLMISDRAHVVFPWHVEEDRLLDPLCGDSEAIGTTMRGIGPCYRDKVGRSTAVRLGDLYRDGFRQRIEQIVDAKRRILVGLGAKPGEFNLDAQAIVDEYAGYAARLAPHVADTTAFLLDAVEANRRILFEGAQGALLDIDHGTFPYVTSSNSSGVGASPGSGVPGRHIAKVIGIIKAYTTRVGGGPFPTEQDNATGQHIRDRGNEYGTVTKRPRRCGWFDAVAARYTARLSGVDELAVMLLDVLDEMPELKICTAYELDGKRITDFPSHVDDLRRVVPVYETLPGWRQSTVGVRRMADLPENATKYLARIGELLARPVAIVSVGPDREQTILA
ncbi:MAG: adenylosuccinate synthase [Pirellulaceae bacterium]|nr:adenylosuccinate synthase [Pirellulaceae bacterium]